MAVKYRFLMLSFIISKESYDTETYENKLKYWMFRVLKNNLMSMD